MMGQLEWVSQDDLVSLIGGLGVSLKIAGLALLVGLPLGVVFAVLSEARVRAVRLGALVLVEVGRGAPLLVLLYLMYYGLPAKGVSLSALAAAVIAFAYSAGATACESFRAALHAVPSGQREAALSLGLGRWDAMRRVVLPQALRVAAPQVINLSILYVQATALTFTIGMPELLSRSYEIGSRTYLFMDVFIVAALIYAAFGLPAAQLARWLERRASARL